MDERTKPAPTSMHEIEQAASPFARECLRRLAPLPHAKVLDVPCGFGRHSVWLAAMGHVVTAIDIDLHRIEATKKALRELPGKRLSHCIVADAEQSLPLEASSFDLAIVIHYYAPSIFGVIADALRPGGVLIFQTFGAQGNNWQSLPESGQTESLLHPQFDIRILRERPCGPEESRAVVHALAARHG